MKASSTYVQDPVGWLFGLHLESGEVLIAAMQFLLAFVITGATVIGVGYAAKQFQTSNTIRYLEEYRSRRMKRRVNRVRVADSVNKVWRSYGMLTHIRDYRADDMQLEPLPPAWRAARPREPDRDDRRRFSNAARLKAISNYFDYVGLLISRGYIDKNLFFSQLCDVTISNWRFLRPYVYYQRLAIRHVSAAEHLASFQAAANRLSGRAAADLRDLIAAYSALGPVSGVGAQTWFERLYFQALAWRRDKGAKDDIRSLGPTADPSLTRKAQEDGRDARRRQLVADRQSLARAIEEVAG